MDGRCDWGNPKQLVRPGCKASAVMGYQYNENCTKRELCLDHWRMLCDWQENGKENSAFKKMGIPLRNKAKPVKIDVDDNMNVDADIDIQPEPSAPQKRFRKKRR